jgi:hypothetical protein
MKRYEWLNTDYILARINERLRELSFELVEPDPSRAICYEVGTLWLIDLSGEIVLEGVDISEFGAGFNLLKSGELFGFEDFVANTCDVLLLKLGYGLEVGN